MRKYRRRIMLAGALLLAWLNPARAADTPPLTAVLSGTTLTLHLAGKLSDGQHEVRLSFTNAITSGTLGSSLFHAMALKGTADIPAKLSAAPGVYRVQAAVDGIPFGEATLFVPGVRRDGGDLLIDGQPFSALIWTWRPLDYVFKKDGGRFANINVQNLLTPVPVGGFGFNCVFTDNTWHFKPADFAYLDKVGGHLCVQTCIWEGLNPWGPPAWNTGIRPDPIILSDGSATKFGSFDSPKNRANFVRDLKLFKSVYGNHPSLLGFYFFESTPDMPWDHRSLYSDYSPASKARFRQWLASRFGTVARFNAQRHGALPSFSAAEPPASPEDAARKGFDSAYWNDWIDFRYWSMAEFQGWARAQIKALFGQDKMLVTIEGLTASYAGNDSNVAGSNSEYAIDERLRARTTDAIGVEGTYDYMPNHVRILRRATDFNGDGLPDIPIIMDYYNYGEQPREHAEPADIPRLRFVDELGEGATGGLLEHSGEWLVRWEENSPAANAGMLDGFRQIGEVNAVRSRYAPLFAKVQVPCDISVVIPVWQLHYDSRYRGEALWWDRTGAAFQNALQRSQREIRMFYADEPIPAGTNALMAPIGYRTSPAFIRQLKAAVAAGAKVYIEGTPLMDETGHAIPFPLADLVGADVMPEPKSEFRDMDGAVLRCDDPRKLVNVQGDVLARFSDGAPAIVHRHYFKGEVTYCPSLVGSAADGWTGATFDLNFPEAYRAYYAGIAATLSPPIMRITGAQAGAEIRLHLLGGSKIVLLLATNWSGEAQDFQADLGVLRRSAFDLRTGKKIPVEVTASSTRLKMHLGGHDWTMIALGGTEADLEAALHPPELPFSVEAP